MDLHGQIEDWEGVLGGIQVVANIFPLHREEITMILDQPIVEEVVDRGGVSSRNSRGQLTIRVCMKEVVT